MNFKTSLSRSKEKRKKNLGDNDVFFSQRQRSDMILLQVSDYEKEIVVMRTMTKEEYLASLRRYLIPLNITFLNKLSNIIINVIGFYFAHIGEAAVFQEVYQSTEELQGNSTFHNNNLSIIPLNIYMLLTRLNIWTNCKHHHNGRWEARIGRVFGNKYLYLGTYSEFHHHILFFIPSSSL